MSDLIEAIIQTRKTAEEIVVKSLVNIENISEVELRDKIISETKNYKELFPLGWYDPPPVGICVLFDEKPFERLQFETLRNPKYWPNDIYHFKKESVAIIYISPVDQKTKMIGDFGFTFYRGDDKEIQEHIKTCYSFILKVAEHAEVGMNFSELCEFGKQLFQSKLKITKWITLFSGTLEKGSMNLGHTIPGSFEDNFDFGKSFEETRETIRTKRIFINSGEEFKIPETCAFTLEARLADAEKEYLPNAFFHFIVSFDKGKKIILNNYDSIFNKVGMDYMNLNK